MSSADANSDLHDDLGAYVVGGLDADELVRFKAHLEGCRECRAELERLIELDTLLSGAAPMPLPSPDLEARVLAAVRRAASGERTVPVDASPPRRRVRLWPEGGLRLWPRRTGFALAGLGVAALAVVAGVLLAPAVNPREERGTLELAAVLTGGKDARAALRVTELPIGREISLRTDDLPVLDNDREFYELWFVGPGDSVGRPNRVSAGTFHPGDDGRTRVRLTAAVVPAQYPRITVSREPRDGNPGRTGPEVLKLTS